MQQSTPEGALRVQKAQIELAKEAVVRKEKIEAYHQAAGLRDAFNFAHGSCKARKISQAVADEDAIEGSASANGKQRGVAAHSFVQAVCPRQPQHAFGKIHSDGARSRQILSTSREKSPVPEARSKTIAFSGRAAARRRDVSSGRPCHRK